MANLGLVELNGLVGLWLGGLGLWLGWLGWLNWLVSHLRDLSGIS